MALSNEATLAVLAEVAAHGIEATTKQIQDAYIASKMASALAVLDQAVSMDVQDWTILEGFLGAGVSSTALYPLRDAIKAKLAARDSTGLAVLLLSFYAADQALRG
jgi:hypothetical protein